jgi:tetratricopeptide (TPR) repeat protein
MSENNQNNFREVPIICDDDTWIWHFISKTLKDMPNLPSVKVSSKISLRHGWDRFKNAQRIVVHWESTHRPGGALIEEMVEINPFFDVAENVIVLTSAPMREDVVYLSELGVARIIRVRHKESDLQEAAGELKRHLTENTSRNPLEVAWGKIHRALNFVSPDTPEDYVDKIAGGVTKLQARSNQVSARYLDAIASINAAKGNIHKAEKLWQEALDVNPNYFRAQNNLTRFYQANDQPRKALEILQRMHSLNKSKISRLTDFGHAYLSLKDDFKAEHYYKRALSRDEYCSGALNGLAEIRFRHGDLEEARQLLSRTALAYQFASQLNKMGIALVKKDRYEDALMHYTKAQYVLPQKEKGPKLFYNIGLCYYKWGKPEMAREFLKIALVKEPGYKKAEQLLDKATNGETEDNAAA